MEQKVTLKFSFQNEIHRCSEPPSTLAALPSFLTSVFKNSLPPVYSLGYVNLEGKNIPLSTEEDYEVLKTLAASKAIKVIIVDKAQSLEDIKVNVEEKEDEDYDMIVQEQERKEEIKVLEDSVREESKDVLEKIAQELTKTYVMPDLLQIQGEIPHESMVQQTVREALHKQLPFILFQVRDTLTKQGLIKLPNMKSYEAEQPKEEVPQKSKGAEILDKVIKVIGDLPENAIKFTDAVATKLANAVDTRPKEKPQDGAEQVSEEKEEKGQFLGDVKNAILNFPNTASTMADNLVHKLSGDPYILTGEGRYPKSVVDRCRDLMVIFPEDDKKEMLDFLQKLPKEISIEQAASLYADFKKI